MILYICKNGFSSQPSTIVSVERHIPIPHQHKELQRDLTGWSSHQLVSLGPSGIENGTLLDQRGRAA
jgi:hypothetical protein